jgi:hypothetical protein
MRAVVGANARQTPIDRAASKPGTTTYAKGDALNMLEKSADEYRTLAARANRMAKRGR